MCLIATAAHGAQTHRRRQWFIRWHSWSTDDAVPKKKKGKREAMKKNPIKKRTKELCDVAEAAKGEAKT